MKSLNEVKDNYRIPIINNLRGIAALTVCLYHFVYTTKNYITHDTILNVFSYGQYGVQIFFVISGIVIPFSLLKSNYSILKFPKFFLKRIIRIEPPYIVAVLLAILILIVRGDMAKLNFTEITLHIGYLIPFFLPKYNWLNNVFWTLGIEFQYYIIISLLILLVINFGLLGRFIFYLTLLIIPFFFTDSNFFPYYAPIFLIGISWCFFFLKKINLIEFLCVLITSFVISYLKISNIESLFALGTLILIHFLKNYSNKILLFFGNISYTFYLIHPLIGASCINLLSHKFTLGWQKPIVIGVGFILTTISSYILYKLIEKPTHELSKKIKF
ncbi:MAG: acyltransferase [Bacteroidota bacterium]|nr:acyltransferase [Bacteroidota bacterium]